MDGFLSHSVGLLVAAIVVALIARRLALPYTVGLVIAGIGLAVARIDTGVALTHDFVFEVILPPLLFEAAINIRWSELRRDLVPVLTFAVAGTVVAAAVIALGLIYVLGWPKESAMLLGSLIAATDPVAVIALFKDCGVTGRLRLLVESESLFNDGVAAVLFALVLAWTQAGDGEAGFTSAAVAQLLGVTVGVGILAGLAVGGAVILVAGRTSDHLLEGTLTTVAAYGSFQVAEHFHGSGVLAAVVAGLLVGNLGVFRDGERRNALSLRGREFVQGLWEFVAFIANSLVFLLIGMAVAATPFSSIGAVSMAVIITLVLVSRAVTVYPLAGLFGRSSWRMSMPLQHVLWWGGLRGALALALALSLPAAVRYRSEILIAAFGVVVFSVIVQGLTMPLLLRLLGLLPGPRHADAA